MAELTLPNDLSALGAKRVGFMGLVYGCAYIIFETMFSTTRPAHFLASWRSLLGTAALAICSGFLMYFLSRKLTDRPRLVLRIGLIFEVLASLPISLGETSLAIAPGEILRGHSAIAIWICTFALVAPAPFRTALAASLAAAAMAPLGLVLNIWLRGNNAPTVAQTITYCTAPFLMAVIASYLARWVYQLGLDLRAAKEMGSYELLETLGAGGMGEVWRARHRFLAREAAIKLILPRGPMEMQVQQRRFEREARVISQLECPHTVSLYDFGATPSGQLYFAMELIRGLNLDQMIRRFGPMPAARVRHILLGVLESLDEAHQAGLTHRDIKPSNILLARLGQKYDFVKVVDFGLVKTAGDGMLTVANSTLGTPAFMAPEAANGADDGVDSRSDIYSLGCVADWLLTGKLVFAGKTAVAQILQHQSEPPTPVSQRTELPVPPGLEALILRCLEKDPARRPATAWELHRDLVALEFPPWEPTDAKHWWQTHLPEHNAPMAARAATAPS